VRVLPLPSPVIVSAEAEPVTSSMAVSLFDRPSPSLEAEPVGRFTVTPAAAAL
jgi:hypothetical protein